MSKLFKDIHLLTDKEIKVKISYVEIYNECIFDLLETGKDCNIILQEDPVYGVICKGSHVQEVSLTYSFLFIMDFLYTVLKSNNKCTNEEEALDLMFEGETNRTISEHKLNNKSSRSHAIFSIILEMRNRVESSEKIHISKINIVDLAGSERTKKTQCSGSILLEVLIITINS